MRLILPILATALATSALAQETRELDAHEHGHVSVQIAVEGSSVEMTLEAPGKNIVGFEHEAETDEQRAMVSEAEEQLSDPLALFELPEAAGCEITASEVELHIEGTHSAFEAEYALECADPSALTSIGTTLFEIYPTIEEIEVEYATPAGQGSGELEPGSATLTIPSTS